MSSTFSPSIRRPIQIQEFIIAIRESSAEELQKARQEINGAIQHLNRSNRRLEAYVAKLKGEEVLNRQELDADGNFSDDDIQEKDLHIFQESLTENAKVLSNYQQRLQAIDQEELHRNSGSGKPTADAASAKSHAQNSQGQSLRIDSDNTAADANESQGIYL